MLNFLVESCLLLATSAVGLWGGAFALELGEVVVAAGLSTKVGLAGGWEVVSVRDWFSLEVS